MSKTWQYDEKSRTGVWVEESPRGLGYITTTVPESRARREQLLFLKYVGLYIVAGFLTFGWVLNHDAERSWHYTGQGLHVQYDDVTSAGWYKAVGCGVLWPVYLAGRVAIYITRWP